MNLQAHPIADSYSQLNTEEYAALVADIHQYGQREAITLFDGMILDGRHRYNAIQDLQELGFSAEPKFAEFVGTEEEAEAFAESLNIHRRHLSYDQRVCRAALYKKVLQEEDRRGRPEKGSDFGTIKGKSHEIAGIKYGVGKTAVLEAESILDAEPDLFAEIQSGAKTLREAQKDADKRRKEREAQMARDADEAAMSELLRAPDVKYGEWYQLGDHRLYCGDTSCPAFYENLPRVPFAFADPPYNADAATWDKDFAWQHDWLIEKAAVVGVTPGIASVFDFARITTMPYKWSAACWINNGMTRGAMGFGNWIYTALFSRKSLHCNSQDFHQLSINPSATAETEHKGRKPSGLLIWFLGRFTKEGDTVIDPFLGSGTTLFAADKSGRKCIGGEINPQFCVEIILRWQQMAQQKAVKIENAL
jgi:16S rRNA G966 N2-methylase RsmD